MNQFSSSINLHNKISPRFWTFDATGMLELKLESFDDDCQHSKIADFNLKANVEKSSASSSCVHGWYACYIYRFKLPFSIHAHISTYAFLSLNAIKLIWRSCWCWNSLKCDAIFSLYMCIIIIMCVMMKICINLQWRKEKWIALFRFLLSFISIEIYSYHTLRYKFKNYVIWSHIKIRFTALHCILINRKL